MDETPSNDKTAKDFNKIDLAQLQSFSFGTQWSQDQAEPADSSGGRDSRRDERPRRDGPGGPSGPRDRRGFKRPAGAGDGPAPSSNPSSLAPAPSTGPSKDFRGAGAGQERRPAGGSGFDARPPRRDGPGGGGGNFGGGAGGGGQRSDYPPRSDFRGGANPAGSRGGGFRREDGPRPGSGRENAFPVRDPGPYVSPFFNVTFYPEDTGFLALAKAIRTSCRTYELFEIARVILGKNDRFVAVIQHKTPETPQPDAPKPVPFGIAVTDGTPFENESAAITYVLEKHLDRFFEAAEVEIEPPKGNFQVVNKCSVTGVLLGPPNYHRYNQIVQQHFAANIKLPFDVYRTRIESVRDPELIAQWLQKMKKTTRYTWKPAAPAVPVSVTPPVGADVEAVVAASESTPPVEVPATTVAPGPSFDSLEDARNYLLTQARDRVVRTVDSIRFHGKNLEVLQPGEIRRTLEGALERQRRFPLDTANALRGRLRRENFSIFKKGSKGISYVSAVKRKFRVPGQVFAESIGALISFIETHPMVKASDLPQQLLGITVPVKATDKPADAGAMPSEAIPAVATLSREQQAKLGRLNGDLRWLVSEGYVTEFIDGRLFAPPPVIESRKKEIESSDHDPENFPEAPAASVQANRGPVAVDEPENSLVVGDGAEDGLARNRGEEGPVS